MTGRRYYYRNDLVRMECVLAERIYEASPTRGTRPLFSRDHRLFTRIRIVPPIPCVYMLNICIRRPTLERSTLWPYLTLCLIRRFVNISLERASFDIVKYSHCKGRDRHQAHSADGTHRSWQGHE